jgi:hypothetical protein
MTINSSVNYVLNAGGLAGFYLLKNVGTVIAPAILGNIGGRMIGIGGHIGLMQGAASAAYHTIVHVTIQSHVNRNEGDPKQGKISPKSARFYRGMGMICTIAVPILFTWYFAPRVDAFCKSMPEGIVKKLVYSEKTKDYGLLTAISTSIAPAVAQHLISFLRKEESLRL